MLAQSFKVNSPSVQYTDDSITSEYCYRSTEATVTPQNEVIVTPTEQSYTFKTERKVPRLGVMIVGLAGNNGSSVVGACIANKKKITWQTKRGPIDSNYFGSITQSSTVSLGTDPHTGRDIFVALKSLVPMVDPSEIVWGGWDINNADLATAMQRAQVFEWDLQTQLREELSKIKPLPSIYFPDFIAANQSERANNVLTGSKKEQMEQIQADIRNFKKANNCDQVVVLWSGTTERFTEVKVGTHDTWANLKAAIERGESEISPSTLFACACMLEKTPYINGSPQNTFVPGVVELAMMQDTAIAGDDFKSGQTKIKSVLVDFLISAGIKPVSIVSYNHLGNNDGKNLSAPQQFRSKEITKSNVVDDMVESNQILYRAGEMPDHAVVIKYVPFVGDSKRALDEYTSEIFMGGLNTIVLHNTCEDSLLAAPIMIDLVVLCELMTRITYRSRPSQTAAAAATATAADEKEPEFHHFHPVLSILSYLLKAPMTPPGTPVVNALFKQRACIDNVLRACVGLPPDNGMRLDVLTGASAKPVSAML